MFKNICWQTLYWECKIPIVCMYVYLRFKGTSTAQVIGTHMNDCDDNDGQMIFGDLGDLKFPDICLTGEEKPHPGNLSRLGIEPGPAA